MGIREDIASLTKISGEDGTIAIGSVTVAYHCDKFNTRIIKGFEDTLGFEKARQLVHDTAESTAYDSLASFIASKTQDMSPKDALGVAFDLFKVLGYGCYQLLEDNGKGGKVKGSPVYTAEGWLENETKWNWEARKEPVCHVESGLIAAVWEIVNNLPKGSVRVNETACRAQGNPECMFEVEVK
ncbi:MAG: hypothetical protein GX421_03945 [Caldisericales bacterium]|nr:hypothetical protein [Caldisericales bacterium]